MKLAKRGFYKLFLGITICAVLGATTAHSQQSFASHPGAEAYTPTRIDWLTTTLQAALRTERLYEDKFLLQIAAPDPETILIYVRYLPGANHRIVNTYINSAREVIKMSAKSYGWDSWLKIREDVQMTE